MIKIFVKIHVQFLGLSSKICNPPPSSKKKNWQIQCVLETVFILRNFLPAQYKSTYY